MGYVYIDMNSDDLMDYHLEIIEKIKSFGINTWFPYFNIQPGKSWLEATDEALAYAEAYILIYDNASKGTSDLIIAEEHNHPIIVICPTDAKYQYHRTIDYPSPEFKQNLISYLPTAVFNSTDTFMQEINPAKGYFFLSYSKHDIDFVSKLRTFLADKKYAYWDYQDTNRHFEMPFHLEIENAIKKSSGIISVVSPDWKASKWSTREYIFSEQVGKTNFVCIIDDVGPTLLFADRTFIEFFDDEEKGFENLDRALRQKGFID